MVSGLPICLAYAYLFAMTIPRCLALSFALTALFSRIATADPYDQDLRGLEGLTAINVGVNGGQLLQDEKFNVGPLIGQVIAKLNKAGIRSPIPVRPGDLPASLSVIIMLKKASETTFVYSVLVTVEAEAEVVQTKRKVVATVWAFEDFGIVDKDKVATLSEPAIKVVNYFLRDYAKMNPQK